MKNLSKNQFSFVSAIGGFSVHFIPSDDSKAVEVYKVRQNSLYGSTGGFTSFAASRHSEVQEWMKRGNTEEAQKLISEIIAGKADAIIYERIRGALID